MSEDEFTKFVHHLIANEKIEDLRNGENGIYKKYGFIATEHDMWQLLLLRKLLQGRFQFPFSHHHLPAAERDSDAPAVVVSQVNHERYKKIIQPRINTDGHR